MKKICLSILATVLLSICAFGQLIDSTKLQIAAIEKSLNYTTGVIDLPSGNAKLTVPDGFRFLDKNQSIYVLTDLWGNPADSSVLGMLVPSTGGILGDSSWAFVVSFEEMGYVKDDDADAIDYNDLLKDLQKDAEEANTERVKLGYEPIKLIGWASSPYYDKQLKTLHWAKEIQFGDAVQNTLNYNLRILGRKGIYNLNAVASMNELPQVKQNIDKIIRCVQYKDGHKYADFIPNVDNVAAWTIGGLVAGKMLAKVGFFAVLAKFWKIILLAIAGAGGGIMKFFKRNKNEEHSNTANKDTP